MAYARQMIMYGSVMQYWCFSLRKKRNRCVRFPIVFLSFDTMYVRRVVPCRCVTECVCVYARARIRMPNEKCVSHPYQVGVSDANAVRIAGRKRINGIELKFDARAHEKMARRAMVTRPTVLKTSLWSSFMPSSCR